MPEQRGNRHRKERLADAIREEIGIILEGELGDPRIGLATISEVLLAPGGKGMHVYVHVDGSEEESEQTIAGLNAAKGYVRHQLGQRLAMRQVPEIVFHVDRAMKYGSRIEELLNRVQKRTKKAGPETQ